MDSSDVKELAEDMSGSIDDLEVALAPLLNAYIYLVRFQAVEYDNRFFVNPGSATGAWIGTYHG